MARPSERVLQWLRGLIAARGVQTAELAKQSGVARARIRRVLIGTEPMLVDELLALTEALQLRPADFAGIDLGPVGEPAPTEPAPAPPPDKAPVDPWGNQPEQLFRIAFALGCDVLFTAATDQLADSGVPDHVLEQYKSGQMPIELNAEFHSYNRPRFDEQALTLTLSFDALYECRFPWSSIRRIVFSPAPYEPAAAPPPPKPKPQPPARPRLRLVE